MRRPPLRAHVAILMERGHGDELLPVMPAAGLHDACGGRGSDTGDIPGIFTLSMPGTDGGANYLPARPWGLVEDRRAREATPGEPAGGEAGAGHWP